MSNEIDEEELRLDEEFMVENKKQLAETFKQLEHEKRIIHLYSDLNTYLDRQGLKGVIFNGLTIDALLIQIDS
jgi:hypothetical protein